MSLHALGGPSKHNAMEEFWRERLAKEANPAAASTVTFGDNRLAAGFGAPQRTAFVPSEPLIPRAGDYRCVERTPLVRTHILCLARPWKPGDALWRTLGSACLRLPAFLDVGGSLRGPLS